MGALPDSQSSRDMNIGTGRQTEVDALSRQPLRLDPLEGQRYFDTGIMAIHEGRFAAAAEALEEALPHMPNLARLHHYLATAYRNLGYHDKAVHHFHQVVRFDPELAQAYNNWGIALAQLGEREKALAAFALALRLKPQYAEAHNNIGNVLTDYGPSEKALEYYQNALRLQPNYIDALVNLGKACRALGRHSEAIARYKQVLEIQPGHAGAIYHLRATMSEQDHLNTACGILENALRPQQKNANAPFDQTMAMLLQGDFVSGVMGSEWREKRDDAVDFLRPQSMWDGSALAGRTILLRSEQILGDTIRLARLGYEVQQRGGHVILECPNSLLSLMTSCPGIDKVVARKATLPLFDAQIALAHLPDLLGINAENIPARIPYLYVPSPVRQRWSEKIFQTHGFKVGIDLYGETNVAASVQPAFSSTALTPLFHLQGLSLFSLQKGATGEQLAVLFSNNGYAISGPRLDASNASLLDVAAVLTCLDLLVTSNLDMAQLAGALGVPVWIVLAEAPDQRWLSEGETCPWYPTMRIFRQRQHPDRQEMWEQIGRNLQAQCVLGSRALGGSGRAQPLAFPGRDLDGSAQNRRKPRATVCMLTHGDYIPYIKRCLGSVLDNTPLEEIELRIGFNNAPNSYHYTRECLGIDCKWIKRPLCEGVELETTYTATGMKVGLWSSAVNLYKEPMCRLMYYSLPLETEYAIWFDDDSFVDPGWWRGLCELTDQHVDYIGQEWGVYYLPGQTEMIRTLPWYRGVPFEIYRGGRIARYLVGGFMAVRSARLREADFPDTQSSWKGDSLKQYGGDAMLGEIARQLGWTRANHSANIHVNVDLQGKHPAPRRGGTGRQFGSDIDVIIH